MADRPPSVNAAGSLLIIIAGLGLIGLILAIPVLVNDPGDITTPFVVQLVVGAIGTIAQGVLAFQLRRRQQWAHSATIGFAVVWIGLEGLRMATNSAVPTVVGISFVMSASTEEPNNVMTAATPNLASIGAGIALIALLNTRSAKGYFMPRRKRKGRLPGK